MEFVELTEKEFNDFGLNNEYGNFHQTSNWGKLKEKNGWKSHLLGVKEDGEIKAACLLLQKRVLKKFSLFYSPRGYLLDYNNYQLLEFFTKEIKNYVKKYNAIFVKIDPYVIHKERDINGDIVEEGLNNESIIGDLKQLGYVHTGFNLKHENMQPRWAFALDLKDKSEDEILNGMESKTRQLIRKNMRWNISVREIKKDELQIFKDIMNSTADRRNFIDRPFEYYKNMLEVLKDNAKIYIAELNVKDLVDSTKKEIDDNKKLIEEKETEIKEKKKNINIDKTNKKIKELTETNERLEKKLEHYEDIRKEDGDLITLGGIIYMIYNKEILSLFGGSYDKYMEFQSFYTIHWELIKYALNNGFEKYNFYGITGDFKDTKDELYGIYDFKRGFGGHVEEYIGEFDLITNKFMYLMYKYGFSLYKKIKK